jgi:hypothetical protein
MPYDPTLGAMAQPQAGNPNATPEEKMAYEAGWTRYLQDPAIRSGLLQFAINAGQPVPVQQTGTGALLSAVGGGAEAYDRNLVAQQTQANEAVKQQQQEELLANQRRGQDVTAGGNRSQYDLGMAEIGSREKMSAAEIAGRELVARLNASNDISTLEKKLLGDYMTFNAANPAALTPEKIEAFRAQLRAQGAAGPATAGPATGGPATISTQEEYRALEPGTTYKVPNDPQTYTKPQVPTQ